MIHYILSIGKINTAKKIIISLEIFKMLFLSTSCVFINCVINIFQKTEDVKEEDIRATEAKAESSEISTPESSPESPESPASPTSPNSKEPKKKDKVIYLYVI